MMMEGERRPSKLLEAYRAVAAREPIDECDVWIAELKLANPRQFALDLAKMEKEWVAAAGEEPVVVGVEADEGTERCVEMVRHLLGGGDGPGEA